MHNLFNLILVKITKKEKKMDFKKKEKLKTFFGGGRGVHSTIQSWICQLHSGMKIILFYTNIVSTWSNYQQKRSINSWTMITPIYNTSYTSPCIGDNYKKRKRKWAFKKKKKSKYFFGGGRGVHSTIHPWICQLPSVMKIILFYTNIISAWSNLQQKLSINSSQLDYDYPNL